MAQLNDRLGVRALGLLALWAGFYLLGLSIAGALLWIPWAQITYSDSPDPGGLLAGFGGLWVLWGLRPRFNRAKFDGVPLPEGTQQRLRNLVKEVARDTNHPEPDEIHLVVDANAFTFMQRRFLGKKRFVIGVGLPLLGWLDRDALRSVIAHEIGHHKGENLRLGPWVHRTRRSVGETLEHLEGSSFLLDLPFALYGEAFMKRSFSVSRAQEYFADAVAARTAGVDATARALAIIGKKGTLWATYFWTEVAPAIDMGFLPPVFEGFGVFEANVASGEQSDGARPERRAPTKSAENDTHPTLAERLESLERAGWDDTSGAPSLRWLDESDAAEELAIRSILVNPNKKLERIAWGDVTERVWLPLWKSRLQPVREGLQRLSPKALAGAMQSLDHWASVTRTGLALLSPEADRRRAMSILAIWLLVHLSERGFAVQAPPGASVRAVKDGAVVEPFNVVKRLATGALTAPAWDAQCSALGLD